MRNTDALRVSRGRELRVSSSDFRKPAVLLPAISVVPVGTLDILPGHLEVHKNEVSTRLCSVSLECMGLSCALPPSPELGQFLSLSLVMPIQESYKLWL